MKKSAKVTIFVVNTLLCVLIILGTAFLMQSWGWLVKTVFFVSGGAGIIAGISAFVLNKQAILKSSFILVIVVAVFLISFIVLSEVGHLNDYETDEEKIAALERMIKDTGAWGMLVFFLIQVAQVVILPLPAVVCYVPGSHIWGPLIATLLASAGVIAGSVISYFIGKFFGKKAVVWIAGKETTEKYSSYLAKRGKVIFVLMQILPFFPDDILCMIAGLTGMNFLFFIISIVLVRPIIIALYCYLGSGTVIPFSGWGIAVWIVIFAACIVLAVLSFKYQDKIENWLVNTFTKGRKSKSKNTAAEQPPLSGDTVEEAETVNGNFSESTEKDGEPPPDNEN